MFRKIIFLSLVLCAGCSARVKKYVASEHLGAEDQVAHFQFDNVKTKKNIRVLGIGKKTESRVFLYKAKEKCLQYMGALEIEKNKPSEKVSIPAGLLVFKLFRRTESHCGSGCTKVNYEHEWGKVDAQENQIYSLLYDNTTNKGFVDIYLNNSGTRIERENEAVVETYLLNQNGNIVTRACD